MPVSPSDAAALGSRTRRTSPAAIREIKAALRARIAASGRTVEEVFARHRAAGRGGGRGHHRGAGARRGDLAGHRLRRHRGRHGVRADTGTAASPRLPRRARPLRPGAGAGLGPRHRRLRREQPLLRELPRPRRRLLRQRRAPSPRSTRSTGHRPRCRPGRATGWPRVQALPQRPVAARVRRHPVVRPGPRLALPRPHPPSPGRRRLRRASAPTSTPAPSTCG